MMEQPSSLGWQPWHMIVAALPQMQGRACSVRCCGGEAVVGIKRRVHRGGGYQFYWQPYCGSHAERRGVAVTGGRVHFVAGFSAPLA